MSLNKSKIRKWSFSERLNEIESRIDSIIQYNSAELPKYIRDNFDEIIQILRFWKSHMKDKSKTKKDKSSKVSKNKKPQNIW